MALNGTISKSITGRKYYIEWSATQSISGNYSTITCKHYLKNDATYSLRIDGRSNTCTVGGVSDDFSSAAINTSGGSTIHLGTTTHKVNHNADGSKSVTIKGVFNIQATLSGTYYSSLTASGTVTLDAIPRAASITSAPNFTDEDNPTIKYSNPAGSAVDAVYAAIYGADGSTEYVAYRSISKTGTSYTFELTDAERTKLIAACTTAKSMTVRFYLRTALGGTNYNKYMEKTLTIANATPTLAPTVKDSNATTKALTGDESKLIKGYSSAAYTIGASAKKQATIKSQKVTCGDKRVTAASGTLTKVESGAFTFSVTDSRGHTATKTLTKSLINYVALTCSMKVGTPTADGKCAIQISGSYFNGSFGAVANTLTVQYRRSTDGGSTWGSWTAATATKSGNSYSATVNLTGLDYQQAYTFQARAVDKLATVNTATKTVKATPVFDWGEDEFNFNVYAYMANNKAYRSYSAEGEPRNVAYINASNTYRYGQGSWQNNEGAAYFEGNEVTIRSNGDIAITSPTAGLSARAYGMNKELWSGAYYMNASQTVTLSEAVSAQPNGIVLVFSAYSNGASDNAQFHSFFVPKALVAAHPGKGSEFIMASSNTPASFRFKYLYISDTSITGNADNTWDGTASAGVKVTNTGAVLRYVIGV